MHTYGLFYLKREASLKTTASIFKMLKCRSKSCILSAAGSNIANIFVTALGAYPVVTIIDLSIFVHVGKHETQELCANFQQILLKFWWKFQRNQKKLCLIIT